jgi:hypothetical protein
MAVVLRMATLRTRVDFSLEKVYFKILPSAILGKIAQLQYYTHETSRISGSPGTQPEKTPANRPQQDQLGTCQNPIRMSSFSPQTTSTTYSLSQRPTKRNSEAHTKELATMTPQ